MFVEFLNLDEYRTVTEIEAQDGRMLKLLENKVDRTHKLLIEDRYDEVDSAEEIEHFCVNHEIGLSDAQRVITESPFEYTYEY